MKVKKVILFGAGINGKHCLNRIGSDNVAFFVDNNEKLHGTDVEGIKVISPSEMREIYCSDDYRIVIGSTKYFDEISTQLLLMGIDNVYTLKQYEILSLFEKAKSRKRIILTNTHAGTNLGDHFITIAEHMFFDMYLEDYDVIEITADLIDEEFDYIKKFIKSTDIVAVSGGGYMGSLWPVYGENNVRTIIAGLPQNKIIILPQSVFYEDTKDGIRELAISQEIYNQHEKLIICLREKKSFAFVKKEFKNSISCFLLPDMVAIMNYSVSEEKRTLIGLCLRNDKEAVVSKTVAEVLLRELGREAEIFDMHTEVAVSKTSRKKFVSDYICKFRRYRFVVTDRLHCMLLCAITGTPCIAFDNLTNKVSGVYEWIKDNEYIHVVKEWDEARIYMQKYKEDVAVYNYNQSGFMEDFKKLASLFEEECN